MVRSDLYIARSLGKGHGPIQHSRELCTNTPSAGLWATDELCKATYACVLLYLSYIGILSSHRFPSWLLSHHYGEYRWYYHYSGASPRYTLNFENPQCHLVTEVYAIVAVANLLAVTFLLQRLYISVYLMKFLRLTTAKLLVMLVWKALLIKVRHRCRRLDIIDRHSSYSTCRMVSRSHWRTCMENLIRSLRPLLSTHSRWPTCVRSLHSLCQGRSLLVLRPSEPRPRLSGCCEGYAVRHFRCLHWYVLQSRVRMLSDCYELGPYATKYCSMCKSWGNVYHDRCNWDCHRRTASCATYPHNLGTSNANKAEDWSHSGFRRRIYVSINQFRRLPCLIADL